MKESYSAKTAESGNPALRGVLIECGIDDGPHNIFSRKSRLTLERHDPAAAAAIAIATVIIAHHFGDGRYAALYGSDLVTVPSFISKSLLLRSFLNQSNH